MCAVDESTTDDGTTDDELIDDSAIDEEVTNRGAFDEVIIGGFTMGAGITDAEALGEGTTGDGTIETKDDSAGKEAEGNAGATDDARTGDEGFIVIARPPLEDCATTEGVLWSDVLCRSMLWRDEVARGTFEGGPLSELVVIGILLSAG